METWIVCWMLVAGAVVADNRRLRRKLSKQEEELKQKAGTLEQRVWALENDDRRTFVWERMIRGVLESTN